MDHHQKRQEKHELDRKDKQADERASERQFSKPGAGVRPVWLLVGGFLLTVAALIVWMRAWATP
jgi:hypothetical protein